jgi:hypothetical protein
LGGYKRCTVYVSQILEFATVHQLTKQFRSLTTVAEKLGWPMPVNYAVAAPSDRKAFEDAFMNLLRLQTM